MSEPDRKSKLAEWGSRQMTGREKVIFSLVSLILLAGAGAVYLWAANGEREGREELEEVLNARYKQTIEVGVSNVGGRTIRTFVIDGVQRPDCKATQDALLKCDDPKLTPEDE